MFQPLLLLGQQGGPGRPKPSSRLTQNGARTARLLAGLGVLFTLLGGVVTILAEYTKVL